MQQLNFSSDNFQKLSQGKRTTIRLGTKPLALGPVALMCDDQMNAQEAEITEIRMVRFGDLGLQEAVADGFNSTSELRQELERCYQQCVSDFEPVSLVRFEFFKERKRTDGKTDGKNSQELW